MLVKHFAMVAIASLLLTVAPATAQDASSQDDTYLNPLNVALDFRENVDLCPSQMTASSGHTCISFFSSKLRRADTVLLNASGNMISIYVYELLALKSQPTHQVEIYGHRTLNGEKEALSGAEVRDGKFLIYSEFGSSNRNQILRLYEDYVLQSLSALKESR